MSRRSLKCEASDIIVYMKNKKKNNNIENDNKENENNVADDQSFVEPVTCNDSYGTTTQNLHKAENYNSLKEKMAEWATLYNVRHNAVNALLKILQSELPGLPLDSRSLKQTPRTVPVSKIEGGEYVHYGVADSLTDFFRKNKYEANTIDLNINIDGLPLFSSSKTQAWPILININNTLPVLVAGIFVGQCKPANVNEYMKEFVTELSDIIDIGFCYHGKIYEVRVRAFICDAPARAFAMGVKGHTAYNSCIKCKQHGEYFERRMTFCLQNSALRTNVEFREKTNDEFHNIKPVMAIEKLPIDIVRQFALDYMHIVCLGVVKTLLNTWIKVRNEFSLTKAQIGMLENNLMSIKCSIGKEFARKPRELMEIAMWKAVEFRQFLLYSGLVVLKGILTDERYKHFLLLSTSIRILLGSDICLENNICAKPR